MSTSGKIINGYIDMGYSQNGEDLIISEYFRDFTGVLLDIGANDGITFSNSRLLIQKGWEAVLIEPSLAYGKLKELYKSNKKVSVCDMIISDSHKRVDWFELDDSLLSTVHIDLSNRRSNMQGQKIAYPYTVIDEKYGHNFDFISIDAEGEDWNILQQIDLANTKCICIEYGKHEAEMKAYCAKYGMKLLHRNGENLIFVR